MKNYIIIERNNKGLVTRVWKSNLSEWNEMQQDTFREGREVFTGWDKNRLPLYAIAMEAIEGVEVR